MRTLWGWPLAVRLCNALLRAAHSHENLHDILAHDAGSALETLMAERHVKIAPPVHAGDPDLALHCVAEGLAKLTARRGALQEIEDAMEDMTGLVDEGLTWRLGQAAQARNEADRTRLDDRGLDEDRPAMLRNLDAVLAGASKPKKHH